MTIPRFSTALLRQKWASSIFKVYSATGNALGESLHGGSRWRRLSAEGNRPGAEEVLKQGDLPSFLWPKVMSSFLSHQSLLEGGSVRCSSPPFPSESQANVEDTFIYSVSDQSFPSSPWPNFRLERFSRRGCSSPKRRSEIFLPCPWPYQQSSRGEYCRWYPLLGLNASHAFGNHCKAQPGTGLMLGIWQHQSKGGDRKVPQLMQVRGLKMKGELSKLPQESETENEHDKHSWRAVEVALLCNGVVLAMKSGVFIYTGSSVMLAECVHSVADLANQGLLAFGLRSSQRAPDKIHPYGYSKERFVWALVSATGIFCLGSGLTVMHGVQAFFNPHEVENIAIAAGVLFVSFLLEGTSLLVAFRSVQKAAQAEMMTLSHYISHGHDPTAVAVLMEDGAAVVGIGIAGAALVAVHVTGNPIYDALGAISVGALLGCVAMFLIQRNRHSLLGRSMDAHQLHSIIQFLKSDPVVRAVWDCKSEVIGPGAFRFKAEIDFNGDVVVRHHLQRVNKARLFSQIRTAAAKEFDDALDHELGNYARELMTALGSEVDRLEREICRLVPEIRHVDIEVHSPLGPLPNHTVTHSNP